jgi:hypothetical protein
MLAEEQQLGLTGRQIYEDFAERVLEIRKQVCCFVQSEATKGKQIYGYGASTKGNTILQYFGLDHKNIQAAAERNPTKWGKYTVGTWIPIVPEDEARANADYLLVLPWHFIDEFQTRERAFLAAGGKLIVPLPTPRIIDASGTVELENAVTTKANQSRPNPKVGTSSMQEAKR